LQTAATSQLKDQIYAVIDHTLRERDAAITAALSKIQDESISALNRVETLMTPLLAKLAAMVPEAAAPAPAAPTDAPTPPPTASPPVAGGRPASASGAPSALVMPEAAPGGTAIRPFS
jgi:hypothetical protein